MNKYTIILKKNCSKDEFKSQLESVSIQEFIPNRECQILEDIKDTRGLVSILSKEEAYLLSQDPRIQSVQQQTPQFLTNKLPIPKISGIHNIILNNEWVIPIEEENLVIKNNINNDINAQSINQTAKILNLPDGEGVDVVIVDGLIGGVARANIRCSGINASIIAGEVGLAHVGVVHPELKNYEGSSRFKNINWNSYVGKPGIYNYSEAISIPTNHTHGLHVAGTACGLRQGWAKNSTIYNILPPLADGIPLSSGFEYLTAIKNWHLDKANHPSLSGRPTITNHSYGYSDPIYDIRSIISVNVNGTEIPAPRETSVAVVEATIGSSGFIESYTVVSSGAGYTNNPTISFNGGGGDEADLIMGSGSIKTIIVTNAGSGYDYNNPPTINFSNSISGITASGLCVVDSGNGSISKIIMIDRGTGYSESSPPSITFSSPSINGIPATGYCIVKSNFIKEIKIINGVDGEYWRTTYGLLIDPPMLVIAGGSPVKEAIWRISQEPEKNGCFYPGGNICDGLYEIAEKKTQLSSTSFSQNLLGGEYASKPSVSFTYPLLGVMPVGPWATASIIDGKISAISGIWFANSPGSYCQPGEQVSTNENGLPCFTGIGCPSGWFTSNPQVYITNGGGFTENYLNNLGILTAKFNAQIKTPNTGCAFFSDKFTPTYVYYHPSRNILMDSMIEDLVDSGAVVVCAAGNIPALAYRPGQNSYNTRLTANLNYLYKSNPSIPCDDGNVKNDAPWRIGYTYRFAHEGLPYGDNIFDFYPLRGSTPGAASGAICVGSYGIDSDIRQKSSFSVTGPRIDIWAPGENVISSVYRNKSCFFYNRASGIKEYPDGPFVSDDPIDKKFGLAKLTGTSMASPQVCGAIACYFTDGNVERSGNLTQQAINWINNSANRYIQSSGFPRNLSGASSGVLRFPGATVSYL